MRRVALALIAASACNGGGGGKDADGDFPRACDASQVDLEGNCVLYSGPSWTAEDVQENCTQGGTLMPDCPAELAVGSCTLTPGEFETVTTFYTPFWTGSDAITGCEQQGGAFEEP